MKVVVIGAGNGGCFTALHWGWWTRNDSDIEVELIYNPETSPERVGQATLIDAPSLLWAATDFNWYDILFMQHSKAESCMKDGVK